MFKRTLFQKNQENFRKVKATILRIKVQKKFYNIVSMFFNDFTVYVGFIPVVLRVSLRFIQHVWIPARFPPKISEPSLSPTMRTCDKDSAPIFLMAI